MIVLVFCLLLLTQIVAGFPKRSGSLPLLSALAGSGVKPSKDSSKYSNKSALDNKEDENNGLKSILNQFLRGLKARSDYDSSFTTKLSVELLVGFTTQVVAEVGKRGANSLAELDFIIADIIMGLSANFAAVYLSAPYGGKAGEIEGQSKLQEFLASCPVNAFQCVAPGKSKFTLLQRIFSIVKAAPKLFIIGAGSMFVGTGFTGALSSIRTLLSGGSIEGISIDALLHLLQISAAIGVYLAVSTNLRYQFVAGILEERIIDPLFKTKYPNTLVQGLCSGFVRTCNTFFGSVMMIDYLKILGLQGY